MRHALMRLAAALALLAGLPSPALPADAIALKPFDRTSPEAIRRSLAGRAHLLVFWSLYCVPCREEMEHWGRLQRRHPDVPILLVATDGASERQNVETFLRRQRLGRVQTWIFAEEFAERLRFAVDPKWRGEVPRVYFVDARHDAIGYSGRVDPASVSRWMAQQR